MVKVQRLLVNAVMVVDLWVTSVASGSTSISSKVSRIPRNVINGFMVVALLVTPAISGSLSASPKCSFYQPMRSERQEFVVNRQSR